MDTHDHSTSLRNPWALTCAHTSRRQYWLGCVGCSVSACWRWEWRQRVAPHGHAIAETVGGEDVILVRNGIRHVRHADLHVEQSVAGSNRYRVVLPDR